MLFNLLLLCAGAAFTAALWLMARLLGAVLDEIPHDYSITFGGERE
jgi:hypothetical protein